MLFLLTIVDICVILWVFYLWLWHAKEVGHKKEAVEVILLVLLRTRPQLYHLFNLSLSLAAKYAVCPSVTQTQLGWTILSKLRLFILYTIQYYYYIYWACLEEIK